MMTSTEVTLMGIVGRKGEVVLSTCPTAKECRVPMNGAMVSTGDGVGEVTVCLTVTAGRALLTKTSVSSSYEVEVSQSTLEAKK